MFSLLDVAEGMTLKDNYYNLYYPPIENAKLLVDRYSSLITLLFDTIINSDNNTICTLSIYDYLFDSFIEKLGLEEDPISENDDLFTEIIKSPRDKASVYYMFDVILNCFKDVYSISDKVKNTITVFLIIFKLKSNIKIDCQFMLDRLSTINEIIEGAISSPDFYKFKKQCKTYYSFEPDIESLINFMKFDLDRCYQKYLVENYASLSNEFKTYLKVIVDEYSYRYALNKNSITDELKMMVELTV